VDQEEVTSTENDRLPGLARSSLRLPVNLDEEIWRLALRYAFIYSMAGLVLGLACLLGGIALFLHGVAGKTSWVASVLGLHSSVTDAAPGTLLFIVGLIAVFVTRYNVKTETRDQAKGRRSTPK